MENKENKEIVIPSVTIQEFMNIGSDSVTEQLVKMTRDKVIAPYSLISEYRFVIELYKSLCSGAMPDKNMLTEAQRRLNFAIDYAEVNNLPFEDFEALKSEINHIKYNLI